VAEMTRTKICGLNDEAGIAAAVKGGARYVGFIFFPKSPRNVTPERAAVLARAAGDAETVAVMVDPRDEEIEAVRTALAPDWIQLHGGESPARVGAVRASARRGVIKAVSVSARADLAAARPYESVADMLMFDAKAAAGAATPGGNGRAFDWTILNGTAFARPWLLSGGLDPENVVRAIGESGAAAVDVSTGVERAPGIKDPDRIAAFLAAVAGVF
jgi:phosphoribosylanthranilate isomerase